jgi:hypothetical protein
VLSVAFFLIRDSDYSRKQIKKKKLEPKRSDICDNLFYFLRNAWQLSGGRVFGIEITFLFEN